MKPDAIYGVRSDRHQAIMMMDAETLHAAHTFTAELTFNEAMIKGQFIEAKVPDASCIFGVSIKEGKPHRFCVGNEQAEILPKFLMAKLIVIESGKAFGAQMSITIDDEERDRLYAMVREAQLRGISPLACTKPVPAKQQKKKLSTAAANHKGGAAAKKQKVNEMAPESSDGEAVE